MQLVPIAVVVAVVAAVRSTWSPCGWSMLSTLVPLSERSRGHRWGRTASWFVAGAVVGGAALGGVSAALARLVAEASIGDGVRLALAVVLVAVGASIDGRLLGPALPHQRRQVDEGWIDQFRPWVYAGGFGLQIGSGLATYVMTTGVYLVVALGALTASPSAALALGTLFGTLRGAAVLAGAGLGDPGRLARFHQRFAALDDPVRVATARSLVAAAAGLGLVALGATPVLGGFLSALVAVTALGSAAVQGAGSTTIRPNAAFTSSTDAERRSTEPTTA